ncbi:probable histone-lysine N-methyltransferase set-23 [Sitodiplosis mosellana]|uniref:probable histone-lysine N-methyltransferase set-23 n=1 Tax=Sitodiplosis mosellana TaxID=263140 RepID=UPI002445314A|nr:probable histone-lysine N-methyltransferase set-23 [Sitodiplosis mosellana]
MDDLNRGNSYECRGQLCIDLFDEYEHIDDSIEYVMENLLQTTKTEHESYHALLDKFNSFITMKCECTPDETENTDFLCTQAKCVHGGNYVIFKDQLSQLELMLDENRKSRDVIYECSELCLCPSYCHNRLIQFGPRKDLKIEDYSQFGKQYGLTTMKTIPKGGFICEYAGEVLCKEEATIRSRTNDENGRMNYIICLNERPIGCGDGEAIQTFIDPSRIGNIGRYLNHSCDANCQIISVRVDALIPKLGIFAKRAIAPNEELCFDYGEDENKLNPSAEVTNRKLCFCGTSKCRKYLPNL